MPQNNVSNVQNPRAIIRMISSKFAARPSPHPESKPELSTEQRDAALRARGLLPQLPQLQAPRAPVPVLDQRPPSPADIVKQEWAAKNAVQERERFQSFKFGRPSVQLPPEHQLPSPPRSPVQTVVPQSPPNSTSPPLRALPTPPDTPQSNPSTVLYPTISLTPPVPTSNDTTPTVQEDVSHQVLHHRIDSFAQLQASISSNASLPTDNSFQILRASVSLPSLPTVSGSTYPKPPKPTLKNPNGLHVNVHQGPSVPLVVESPVDLLFVESPVTIVDQSPAELLASQEVLVVEDEDNDAVPLVPLRKTTPVIATATPAATPNSPQRSLIPSAPKSPTISVTTQNSTLSRKGKRGMTDPSSGAEAKRKMTNPFKRGDRKSPGKVVDDTVVEIGIGDETPKPQPRPRRLTMGSSLSNLRRSVVGTLYRPSNSDNKNGKGFDASHLPPSPTIPSSFNANSPTLPSSTTTRSRSRGGSGGSSSNEGKLAFPLVSPRVCQNIAMHNHGTIQSETAAIEDDETRRMTELAFLG